MSGPEQERDHGGPSEVPRVSAEIGLSDKLGSWKARWGIGRMRYVVEPGLYALGEPTAEAPVLVTASYKMSFDRLRAELPGRSAWILVLDTKGINVWCAAGKGTFATDELVRSVESVELSKVVSHRKLVLPQLGAPGVSASEVKKRCGFRVVYGPVRATDLPTFLDAGMKATAEMRRVRFGLWDRIVLAPVELVGGGHYALLLAAAFLLLGGFAGTGYSLAGVRTHGLASAVLVLSAFVLSAVLGPALLPWLPGRAFSIKGASLGALMVAALAAVAAPGRGPFGSWLELAPWVVLVPTLASFVLMNFTGASTFTSLSGVMREMRFAVPAQIAGAVVGVGLWLAALFLGGGAS